MTDLVYDYADIASRMKGELKQEPESMPKLMHPRPDLWWRSRTFCAPCNGSGMDPMHGGICNHCNGSGVSP